MNYLCTLDFFETSILHTSLRHGPDGSNINVTTLVLSARNLVDDHLSNARSTRFFEGFIHICKSACYRNDLYISYHI